MIVFFNEIVNNTKLLVSGAYIGVLVTVVLIVLLFIKSSRDERGRAIIGKASIISTIMFILMTNFVAKMIADIDINYVTMGNCIQWIYNIVIIVESVAIIILKKMQ